MHKRKALSAMVTENHRPIRPSDLHPKIIIRLPDEELFDQMRMMLHLRRTSWQAVFGPAFRKMVQRKLDAWRREDAQSTEPIGSRRRSSR